MGWVFLQVGRKGGGNLGGEFMGINVESMCIWSYDFRSNERYAEYASIAFWFVFQGHIMLLNHSHRTQRLHLNSG